MDRIGALETATAGFARTLSQVEADHWQLPSPNPGWSVHDLVNHVVGGNRRYVLLLSGASTPEVEALRDISHLTDDPLNDFESTSAEVLAAFRVLGAREQIVHHRAGDRTGEQLLIMRITEHALHGWDLARAIDVDPVIETAVTAVLLDAIESDPLIAAGFTPLDDAEHATGSARLLALTGRR
jgi:uncharacterized protein (TIGR03086 family)